jgi:hypothetical protein
MIWRPSHKADLPARLLADRHYNRQKPGSPQFMPPGRTFVLKASNHRAVFGLSYPYGEYVKHAWPGAWINCIFRNEDAGPLASDMILEALALAQLKWPVPPLGCISFVDPKKVPGIPCRGERVKGFCYMMAGFKVVGETKKGLIAWQLLPEQMPPPPSPVPAEQSLLL